MAKETDLRAAALPAPSRDMRRLVIGLAAVGAGYWIHRLGRRSGVSNRELRSTLPGDELVSRPRWQSTRGITIAARPADVWPWIAQMGFPAHCRGLVHASPGRSPDVRYSRAERRQCPARAAGARGGRPDSGQCRLVRLLHGPRGEPAARPRPPLDSPRAAPDEEGRFQLDVRPRAGRRGQNPISHCARTTFTPAWAWPRAELVIGRQIT